MNIFHNAKQLFVKKASENIWLQVKEMGPKRVRFRAFISALFLLHMALATVVVVIVMAYTTTLDKQIISVDCGPERSPCVVLSPSI